VGASRKRSKDEGIESKREAAVNDIGKVSPRWMGIKHPLDLGQQSARRHVNYCASPRSLNLFAVIFLLPYYTYYMLIFSARKSSSSFATI